MADQEHDNPEQQAEEPAAEEQQPSGDGDGSAASREEAAPSDDEQSSVEAEASGAEAPAANESDDTADAGAGATAHEAEASLDDVQHAADEIAAETGDGPQGVDLPAFERPQADADSQSAALGLLDDVNLHVKVELGRTRMYVEDVLRLNENSVVELDKAAGDPVDVYVNDQHVARGEVLVVNENFCIRISEIIQDIEPESALNGSTS